MPPQRRHQWLVPMAAAAGFVVVAGVLVVTRISQPGAEPAVKDAFERAVEDLGALGVKIEEVQLPDFPASAVAGFLTNAEAVSNFEPFYRDGTISQLSDAFAPYQPEILAVWKTITSWPIILPLLYLSVRVGMARRDALGGPNIEEHLAGAAPPYAGGQRRF